MDLPSRPAKIAGPAIGLQNAHRYGYTIVEVVVAMLLSAVMISAVFSIALSGRQTTARSDRRLVAAQAAQSMMQRLKNYVTGDYSNAALGPNGSWTIAGDSDTHGYALYPGTHNFVKTSGIVPDALMPYNGTLSYTVTQVTPLTPPNCVTPQCQVSVSVTVTWTEP